MAKKAAAPKLQEDIQTDEELYTHLEKPGLWVLDIYSEWCGPCLGMIGSLKKLKLDLGGDNLNYGKCKADTIEVFKRFRRKSEPTWLFVVNHKAVNILFGSNVPQLLQMISYELRLLDLETRNFYALNEMLPEELRRYKIKEDALKKALALELELKEMKRLNYLYEVTDIIMENLLDMGVTIFGPHITRDYIKAILQKADQLKIQCKERKSVIISKKHFENIHFNCSNPIAEEILEQLEGKELLICYWKVVGEGEEVPQILQQFARELQLVQTQVNQEVEGKELIMSATLEPLEVNIAMEVSDFETSSQKSEDKILASQKSTKFSQINIPPEEEDEGYQEATSEEEVEDFVGLDLDFGVDVEESQEQQCQVSKKKLHTKKLTIPPIWVPNNHRTHAALIYTYFRNQTLGFLPPDPEPEPPYVIMAFDSYKRKDLLAYVERLRNDVPMYGFFTSDEVDEAQFITNCSEKYKTKTPNDKLVLKVKKATSHTMLQLVTYGPSYVSPNTLIGQEEALRFFPTNYKTCDQEATEEIELLKTKSKEIDKTNKKITKTLKAAEKDKFNETNKSNEHFLTQESLEDKNLVIEEGHQIILGQTAPAEAA